MIRKSEKKTVKKNKILKLVGSILMVLAALFVVKRIAEIDIDYKSVFNIQTIFFSIVISIIYGIIIIIYCWPWRNFVEMITKVRLPFTETAFVMAKSNLLKYVPGNVFQYIGRNEIAVERGLKHSEVGMATILEVVTNLLAAIILGGCFYFDGFQKVVMRFGKELIMIAIAGAIIVLTAVFFVWYKKKAILQKYIDILNNNHNKLTIMKNLIFFMFNALSNAGLYIITLVLVLNMRLNLQDIYVLSGAYILAWITGFVIPGAPGGIGIRELVMTILIPGSLDVKTILLGLVIYRFINIFGDIFGFLFADILKRAGRKCRV